MSASDRRMRWARRLARRASTMPGQDVAEPRPPSASVMFGRVTIERREQREQPQREGDADAEEDRQRLVAAEAGLHEAQPQRAHLLGRARRLLADALEQRDQRLEARLRLLRRRCRRRSAPRAGGRCAWRARHQRVSRPAATTGVPNTNASSGSIIVDTLYLDLDDLLDPEVPDGLHAPARRAASSGPCARGTAGSCARD